MVKELYEEAAAGNISNDKVQARQALSRLRELIKEKDALTGELTNKKELADIVDKNKEPLISFLDSADAKTRKNAALLIGDLCLNSFLPLLYDSYEKETQLFAKSAYLTAIGRFDYSEYIPKIKEKLAKLSCIPLTDENRKHIAEETRALTELIVGSEGIETHVYTGLKETADIILLTNRRHREITVEQIEELGFQDMERVKPVAAGIRLQTDSLERILPIRTYQDILFLVRGMKTCEDNPDQAARTIVDSQLLKFLSSCHNGKPPFYFRVEYKSKMPLDKKSIFTKRLAAAIEQYSERNLVNTTSCYEFEIRLVENKEGGCNVMVKLFTIPEERFSYRREYIAESIKPVNAALLTALAKEYMIEDARVLDPFCGVGTMLIERQKQVPGNTAYGLDIMKEAIEKASANTEAAGQIIHYINRDYFTFTHEYLFDEVFTNMPFVIGHKTEREIYDIYDAFFGKTGDHLTPQGTIILYSHNKEFVRKLAPQNGYKIIKETEVNVKEGTYLFIIKKM